MTQIHIPTGTDPAAAEYFARLRALRLGSDEGWYTYVAGDPNPGRFLVELAHGRGVTDRVLDRHAFWWILGAGDSYGHGDLVLVPPVVPDLVTLEEAAEILGITVDGVRNRINHHRLYIVYPGGRRRLIRAEVVNQAEDGKAPAAAQEWNQLRALWPPSTRIRDLDTPAPPDPDTKPTIPVSERRIMALTAASRAGLIVYLYVDPTIDVYAASITVDDHTTVRELVGPAVIPWVRGVADQSDRADVLDGLV